MESNYENVTRLSEREEKENEAERLRRKFNFQNSTKSQNNSMNNNYTTTQSSVKMTNDNNIKSLNLVRNSIDKKVPVKIVANKNVGSLPISKNNSNINSKNSSVRNGTKANSNISSLSNKQTKEIKHKKSLSNVPVNINNVVNIVNNNFNTIYSPPGLIPLPMNSSNRNTDLFAYDNLSSNETERKSYMKKNTLKNNPSNQNAVFENALHDISQTTEHSFIITDAFNQLRTNNNSNNFQKHIQSTGEIPSEEDRIHYDRLAYDQNIRGICFQGANDSSSGLREDEELEANERESIRRHDNYNTSADIYNYYKKNSIFVNNPICNLSNRYINDESKHHSLRKNTDYKFIWKIREDKLKQCNLDREKFWKLGHNAMYNILSFIFVQYDDLMKANKSVSKKIGLCLNDKFEVPVKVFRDKFKDFIELQEFYFKQTNIKRGRSLFSVIDLVLKSKIITKEVNTCAEISLTYTSSGKEFIQTWKLDIKKKGDIGFWFASEAEEYNKNVVRFCYYQPIVSFCKDDYVEFRINVFSKSGIIDPGSIQWLDIIILKTPEHNFLDYEKSLIKSNVKYDRIRFCELENVIHVWKNEKSLTKKQNIEEFKKCFQNNFKILSVNYDFCKFYIFKVKMQASAIGCVKKNKFTNVDIEIKPYNESLTNETQCLGLLNINHLGKKVELRVSSYVIFYFTDLYL